MYRLVPHYHRLYFKYIMISSSTSFKKNTYCNPTTTFVLFCKVIFTHSMWTTTCISASGMNIVYIKFKFESFVVIVVSKITIIKKTILSSTFLSNLAYIFLFVLSSFPFIYEVLLHLGAILTYHH